MNLFKITTILSNAIVCSLGNDSYTVIRCKILTSDEYSKVLHLLNNEKLGIQIRDQIQDDVVYLQVPPWSLDDVLTGLSGIELDVIDLSDTNTKEYSNRYISKRNIPSDHSMYNDTIFSDFQLYDSLLSYLLEQPDAVEIQIGKTYNETPIRGVKIGYGPKIIVVTGGMHGACQITPSVATYVGSFLMSDNARAASFRERFTFHILPLLNPDGYEYSWNRTNIWLKNRQPLVEPSCVGVDLQCNFGYQFGYNIVYLLKNPCNQLYVGDGAFSANETLALDQYMTKLGTVESYVHFTCLKSRYSNFQTFLLPFFWTVDVPPDFDDMAAAVDEAINTIQSVNGRIFEYGRMSKLHKVLQGGFFLDHIYAVHKVKYSTSINLDKEEIQSNSTMYIQTTGAEMVEGLLAFWDYVDKNGGQATYIIPNDNTNIILAGISGVLVVIALITAIAYFINQKKVF